MMLSVMLSPCLLGLPLLAGCQENTQGDAVREAYENKAKAIDAQAEQQPTPVAKQIYKDRANAFREEGKDREKGLEGGQPSSGQGSSHTAPRSQADGDGS
jgi:hypothetical protein